MASANTIDLGVNYHLPAGAAVTYTPGSGNTAIVPLKSGNTYYVIPVANSSKVQLAATLTDAQNGNAIPLTFQSAPAVNVKLQIKDFDGESTRDGKPVMGAFVCKDSQGRIYPATSRRLAPDFNLHFQAYHDKVYILIHPFRGRPYVSTLEQIDPGSFVSISPVP